MRKRLWIAVVVVWLLFLSWSWSLWHDKATQVEMPKNLHRALSSDEDRLDFIPDHVAVATPSTAPEPPPPASAPPRPSSGEACSGISDLQWQTYMRPSGAKRGKSLVTFSVGDRSNHHLMLEALQRLDATNSNAERCRAAGKQNAACPDSFDVMLFVYNSKNTHEFLQGAAHGEWTKRAMVIWAEHQFKWWFVKRFLSPAAVHEYDYVFAWDEDLDWKPFSPSNFTQFLHDRHQNRLMESDITRTDLW